MFYKYIIKYSLNKAICNVIINRKLYIICTWNKNGLGRSSELKPNITYRFIKRNFTHRVSKLLMVRKWPKKP